MRKFILLFLVFSYPASGIVIRHDIPPANYELKEAPRFLIDMPHEGHGVLIAENWILTVAHVIFYDYEGQQLEIAGNTYSIESVFKHPNYSVPPDEYLSGNSQNLMMFLASRSDIALIKLSEPVSRMEPISIYKEDDVIGRTISIYGKGATGNGLLGEDQESKFDRILRRCHNVVESVEGHWITYIFDSSDSTLPLEGMHGSGDSGGPSVIHIDSQPYLLGLSSWQYLEGELEHLKSGVYGTRAYQIRAASFSEWIDEVIKAH